MREGVNLREDNRDRDRVIEAWARLKTALDVIGRGRVRDGRPATVSDVELAGLDHARTILWAALSDRNRVPDIGALDVLEDLAADLDRTGQTRHALILRGALTRLRGPEPVAVDSVDMVPA